MQRPSDLAPRLPPLTLWVPPARRATVWWSITALLTGALLGVLAGIRYDVTLGLPEEASAALQSLAFTATWAWMGSGSLAQSDAALCLFVERLPATSEDLAPPS